MIEGFRIERLSSRSDLEPVAITYARVFAGPPWNENSLCQGDCQSYFGLETEPGQPCPDLSCQGTLTEAYPLSSTVRSFKFDALRPQSNVNALMRGNEVAGFSIGYPWTAVDFANQKYRTDQMREQVLNLLTGMELNEFNYVSEVGILEQFRGLGLSNALVEDLLKNPYRLLPSGVVLRTNANSPMVAVCKRFGLTQIYGPEVEVINGDGPKKFVVNSDPVFGIADTENPSRVLFAARAVELPYRPGGACR